MILKNIRLQTISKLLPVVMFVAALAFTENASAEWYAAGYGGLSTDGKFSDVTMPHHGLRLASNRPEFSFQPTLGDKLTQTYKTSDISLANSAVFGGKIGYFFADPSLTWLGLEVDAFTLKPDIKKATLQTTQDITYIPGDTSGCPGTPSACPRGISGERGQFALAETSLRLIALTVNVVARYPGTFFQPYVGIGGGAFYFKSSGQIDGRQVVPGFNAMAGLKLKATEEWGLFVEGRYNLASVDNFEPVFGLSGAFQVFHAVAGVAYHF